MFLRDITERNRAGEELRDSEERYRQVVSSSPDPIMLFDADSKRFIDVNPACEDLYGFSRDEFLRMRHTNITAEPEESDTSIEETVEGRLRFIPLRYHRKKDGTVFPVEISASAFPYKGRQVVCGVIRDITERMRLEEQLRQSQKMDAIGQLAGGIAHDFNNQLAGILGFADILVNELDDEQHRADAEAIVRAAKRSADLTRQLLAFARKGWNLSVPVDVHGVIGEVVTFLKRSIDKRITIQQFLKADPSVTTGDPTQLENAFLNIAINARDAMPEGGKIVFETDVVAFDDERCRQTSYEMTPGQYLQVCITDDGAGMDEQTQKRIFEPFFTTKTGRGGTGMGLAVVYGIVGNHHGAINVDSAPGRGTTFTVYLPLGETTVGEAAPVAAAAPIAAGARILVVDDEAVVRDLAARMLRRLGCKVAVCKDGAEAVDYYRKSWRDVDLVILDMDMPVLGGRDTFIAMREINPEVKALLSSGYGVDGEAQSLLDEGVLGFLQKPYHFTELSHKVADVLG